MKHITNGAVIAGDQHEADAIVRRIVERRSVPHGTSTRADMSAHEPIEMQDPWLSLKCIAAYTGYNQKTIRRAIKSGHLTAYQGAREYRVRKSEVDRWVKGE